MKDVAFEKVKGQIAELLDDFPEPELRIDRKDRDTRASSPASTPVGFGPNPEGYRTDLMFGEVRCGRCGRRFARIGPGHYRATCECLKIEEGEKAGGRTR